MKTVMYTPCLLVMFSLVTLGASEADARVTRVLDGLDGTMATVQQQRAVAIRAAEQAFTRSARVARASAIRDLKRLVNVRTDALTTAAVYRAVLKLDQTDADGRQFFEALGILDEVLAEIQPRFATDLLGNVVPDQTKIPAVVGRYQLVIESARYGADTRWVDVSAQVRAAFHVEQGLIITPANGWAGRDPANGADKQLEIMFSYGPVAWMEMAREGSILQLSLEEIQARIRALLQR